MRLRMLITRPAITSGEYLPEESGRVAWIGINEAIHPTVFKFGPPLQVEAVTPLRLSYKTAHLYNQWPDLRVAHVLSTANVTLGCVLWNF